MGSRGVVISDSVVSSVWATRSGNVASNGCVGGQWRGGKLW